MVLGPYEPIVRAIWLLRTENSLLKQANVRMFMARNAWNFNAMGHFVAGSNDPVEIVIKKRMIV
jgi:hypothetical protein